jgi:hypothetical protein
MFRKIVSNLSFSPAIVGQLGFYAKRLRKEETTRRLGLIFVVFALIVQGLAVFQPPESANASNTNDFVPGGLGLGANRSLNNFLGPYDANSNNIKDVMNHVGITRAEIAAAQFSSWMTPGTLSWGFQPRFSAAQGEKTVNVTSAAGKPIVTVYARPMTLLNGNARIYGWVGYSAKMGWFAIMQACGNLVTKTVPPPPVVEKVKIDLSKTAANISQGSVDATKVVAKESDQIKYTVTTKNSGNTTQTVKLSDNLADVLEYSTLIDAGGGTLNATTKVLSWPDVTLAAGASAIRSFAVHVLDTIPATAQGASDPTSFNCKMSNVFGNSISINVVCPTPKVVERVVTELPRTGPAENLLFGAIVLAVVTYFYARSRQLGKEVKLIRRHVNVGTI